MNVVVVAGPLVPSINLPYGLEDVESLVRPARPGERATTGRCSTCSGTGVRAFRRRTLRCMSTCLMCAGAGTAEGVFLARVVGHEGSLAVTQLLEWGRAHRVRTDLQMVLRDEHHVDRDGAWAIGWHNLDGGPLRRLRGSSVARSALGIAVEVNDHGALDGHVAHHAVTTGGRIIVTGIWDFDLDADGQVRRRWASRRGRSIAWCRRIAFPAEAASNVVRRVTDLLARRSRDAHLRRDVRRLHSPPATSVPPAAISVAAN